MKVNLLYWLYKSKTNSKGLAPIYLRITVRGKSTEMATGERIEPSKWDSSKNKVRGSSPHIASINNSLTTLQAKALKEVNNLIINDRYIDCRLIKAILQGKDQVHHSLIQAFDMKLDEISSLLGQHYSKSTLDKWKGSKSHLIEFLKTTMGREDILLNELKTRFINDFQFFLKKNKGHSLNTSFKHLQHLQSITRQAVINDYITKDPFIGFIKKRKKTEITYLSSEELSNIENKTFAIERLELIKDVFLFSCYTSLAYHEVKTLTEDELQKGIDGNNWIIKKRKKTDRMIRVPLLPKAEEIIKKYENHPLAQSNGTVLPIYSNAKINSYLKEIAILTGINKNITHHMARRTFATTVALSNGVSMETVSKILGHSNMKITQDSYAEIVDMKVSNDISNLISQQKKAAI
jgi:integrase